MTKTRFAFFILLMIGILMAATPLIDLFRSPVRSDYYSHIPLIPLLTAYLIYRRREYIFGQVHYSPMGLLVMAAGGALYFLGDLYHTGLNENDQASLKIFAAVLFAVGDFLFFFGMTAIRRAAFPVAFLIFMVPVPSVLMDGIIYYLQSGSTAVTEGILALTGTLYVREGFVFHLPGLSIEIAKECSGIRSSMALLITVVLASHLLLKPFWKKAVLGLSILPIVLIKNGIRITTLSLLAIHVDQRILTHGFLHKSGGFLFYIPALLLVGLILWMLRRNEKKWNPAQ